MKDFDDKELIESIKKRARENRGARAHYVPNEERLKVFHECIKLLEECTNGDVSSEIYDIHSAALCVSGKEIDISDKDTFLYIVKQASNCELAGKMDGTFSFNMMFYGLSKKSMT